MRSLTGGLILFFASHIVGADFVPSAAPDLSLTPEPALQRSLRHVIDTLNLDRTVAEKHLAVSLVDVTRIDQPRYAGINDREMMYAASLPKIRKSRMKDAGWGYPRPGPTDPLPAAQRTVPPGTPAAPPSPPFLAADGAQT
jgi:hypothetical protein